MSESQRYTGKDLWVAFVNGAGTTVLTGDQRAFSWSLTTDTVESQAAAETNKAYIPTLTDGKASLELCDIAESGTATYTQLLPQTEGTLLWAAQGTASGNPKGGCLAIVTGVSVDVPYADIVIRKIDFTLNGSLLFDHGGSVW